MRLAAYLRVSTDRQAEEGLGLDVQAQGIRAWAKQRGHRVVAWHRDEGVSGSNGIESRDALPDAFDTLRAGRAGGLVVYRLDRLARDLMVQETLLSDLWKLGEVFTTMPGEAAYLHRDDPEDPSRKFIRQVLGALADYERAMIAARLRAGRRRKAERGGFAYGSPPYGMKADAKALVTDPAEAAVVARVHELRGAGQSFRQIAAALDAEGVPTRRGGPWQPAVVRKIAMRA